MRKRIEQSRLRPYLKYYESQAALTEGKSLLLAGQASEASALLDRAVQLDSQIYDPERSAALADAQIALARCLLELGQIERAKVLAAQTKAIHSHHSELGSHLRQPLRDLEARLRKRGIKADL